MNTIQFKAIKLTVFLMIGLFGIICNLYPQSDQLSNLPQFLYPDFSISKVKMKVGKDITIMLNYNLVTEKMIFLQKEKVYDMINQGSVDTIYMNGLRFVPFGKAFYEVIPGPHLTFYIQHRGSILSPPKPAAFGGTSEVSSSTYMNRINLGSEVYNMKLNSDLRVKYDPLYWVKLNETMYCFTGEKQFLKVFSGSEDKIKQYIRSNKLKFENRDDLLKIWSYCNEIIK
jgi:hypothetical protein